MRLRRLFSRTDLSPAASSANQELAPNTAVDLGPVATVLPGKRAVVAVAGQEILLIKVKSRVVAFRNQCPHLARSLSDCVLGSRSIQCAAHGDKYDLRSGRLVGSSRQLSAHSRPLALLTAWVAEDHLFVEAVAEDHVFVEAMG
ncbi:MAG: Rieske (2Fe-2S) protein [Mycobacteriaceae bacterium]